MDKLEEFEEQLLKDHIRWFKEATPEERQEYIDRKKARLSPEGLRIHNLVTRNLQRKGKPNE